ncbi:MAG: hypothetical protein ACYTDW_06655 [Planctomycetota bacterium]|jgi:hypothetical protein
METQVSAKSKKALKRLFFIAFVCIFSFVLGIISLYYFIGFYNTKQITGKWFLLGKPVKSFCSSWSFHGDGCTVEIFRIPKHLQSYFTNPPPKFFNYPLERFERKVFYEWAYVKKWTTGIPTKDETGIVRNALKNWNVPTSLADTVMKSMSLETSHYALVGPGRGPRPGQSYDPANFDFFILDPVNDWLIIIIHDM